MGLFERMTENVFNLALLALDSNSRLRDALGKINQPTPSYSANDLVTDVTQTAFRSMQFWMSVWRPLSEALPTAVITEPAGSIPGNTGLHAFVTVAQPIPLFMHAEVTPLVFLGWETVPAPKDASQVQPLAPKTPIPDSDMDVLRQRLDVYLNVAGTVERGTYQGFVTLAGTPIGIVIVRAL